MTDEHTISLDTLVTDLTSLGVEELSTPIPLPGKDGGVIPFYFRNISTEQEIEAMVAAEEFRGHHWMQRIKCEILSRAVYKIGDIELTPAMAVDVDTDLVDIRVALRSLMMGWGPELLTVLWKAYMVHCQNIENRLNDSFPESTIMTEYEQKFYQRIGDMIEEISKDIITQTEQEG